MVPVHPPPHAVTQMATYSTDRLQINQLLYVRCRRAVISGKLISETEPQLLCTQLKSPTCNNKPGRDSDLGVKNGGGLRRHLCEVQWWVLSNSTQRCHFPFYVLILLLRKMYSCWILFGWQLEGRQMLEVMEIRSEGRLVWMPAEEVKWSL